MRDDFEPPASAPESLPAARTEPVVYEYDAFISYRRRDAADLARWIRDRLQQYRLPPDVLERLAADKRAVHDRRPRIWLDRAFEKSSDDFLTKKVYPALDRSSRLIVVSTPSVFDTIRRPNGQEEPNWLVREIERFVSHPGPGKRGRPIDMVLGLGGAEDRFPSSLHENARWDWIDFRQFNRWRSFGLSEELDASITKLAAGFYDVPDTQLPALRREERRRRNRRLVAISILSSSLALIIGLLALFAWRQQREAMQNAQIADARRIAAEAELAITQQPARLGIGTLMAADAVSRLNDLKLDAPEASDILRRGLALLPVVQERQFFESPAVTVSRHRALFATPGRYFAVTADKPEVQIVDLSALSQKRTLAHDGPLSYLKFSADTRRLLTATGLNEYANPAVWDLTQQPPKKVFEKRMPVREVAISPDGQYVMTSGAGSASVWNVISGGVCSLPATDTVSAAEFSPDKQYLAMSYSAQFGSKRTKSHVALFAAGSCRPIRDMAVEHLVDMLAFSPDSKYLAAAAGSGASISVWDSGTGRRAATFAHKGGGIDNIAFSPKGTYLETSGYDNTTRIWIPQTGSEEKRFGGAGLATTVAFSPDERYVLTSFAGDNVARVWSMDSGSEVARMLHGAPVLDAVFLADTGKLATATDDGILRIWALPKDSNPQHELIGQIQSISTSIDARYLTTVESAGFSDEPQILRIWDFATQKQMFQTELPTGGHNSIGIGSSNRYAAGVSSDGKRAAAVGYWGGGHTAYVWDTESRRIILQVKDSAGIPSIALSPDGQYLATANGALWEIAQQRSFKLGVAAMQIAAFSGDSRHIVTVAASNEGLSCKPGLPLPTGHLLHPLKVPGFIKDVAVSHHAEWVAVTDGRSIRVWDARNCHEAYTISENEQITAIAFDESEQLLATATAEGGATIRRVRTMQVVQRVRHPGYLATVSFGGGTRSGYLLTAHGYVTRMQGESAPNRVNTAQFWHWRLADLLGDACPVLRSYSSREFPDDADFVQSVQRICR